MMWAIDNFLRKAEKRERRVRDKSCCQVVGVGSFCCLQINRNLESFVFTFTYSDVRSLLYEVNCCAVTSSISECYYC